MTGIRGFSLGTLAAVFALFVSTQSVFAEHLDRHEIRHLARQIEERNDELIDRIEGWVEERHDERAELTSELDRHVDRFELALDEFKARLIDHDEPWEVREQAQSVVVAADALGRHIEHADYLPEEIRAHWHELHQSVRELAHHYHVEIVGEGIER